MELLSESRVNCRGFSLCFSCAIYRSRWPAVGRQAVRLELLSEYYTAATAVLDVAH
jgi:hypothetical protein